MDREHPRVNGTFKDADSLKWRDPKSPCSPESPQSPPSLMIRGRTLSITKAEKLKPIKELSKKSRKTRLQLSQAGNLSLKRRETSPDVIRLDARLKPKREPLPMKMRALPQSFWQEPHNMSTSSMSSGSTFPSLLPLFQNDNNNSEVVMSIRPLTPPEEKPRPPKEPKMKLTSPPNTDLLFKLFETVEEDKTKKFVVRRGRPRRVQSDLTRHVLPKVEEDPCMMSNLANRLFPQLSLESKPCSNAPLSCVSVQDGDKSVSLPSINVEKNYSQILTELVSHY